MMFTGGKEQNTLLAIGDEDEVVPFAFTANTAFDIIEYIAGYVGHKLKMKLASQS